MTSRLADVANGLATTVFLLVGLIGAAFAIYVAGTWAFHFYTGGSVLAAGAVGALAVLAVVAASARIPVALVALCGFATVCGVALVVGESNALLP